VYRVRRVDLYLVQCCGGVPGTGRCVCTRYNIGEMYQVQGIEFVPGTFLLSGVVPGTIERDCAWHKKLKLIQAQHPDSEPGSKGQIRARHHTRLNITPHNARKHPGHRTCPPTATRPSPSPSPHPHNPAPPNSRIILLTLLCKPSSIWGFCLI
jgi:hypothetical protein